MKTVLWWVRRDLRLEDNPALTAAVETGGQVVPVFVLDPALLNSPYCGEKRLAFMLDGLRALEAGLQARGGRLIVRRGDPVVELRRLVQASGAQAVYAEPDYSPYARRRDQRAAAELPLEWRGAPVVQPPGAVLKSDGEPYVVYTPFSKAWKALPQPGPGDLLPAPPNLATPSGLPSEPLPAEPRLAPANPFPPGEAEAQRRLAAFAQPEDRGQGIFAYKTGRNQLAEDGTSQLSPYLRFGMLSARQAVVAARQAIAAAPDAAARAGAETWLNELIWREFYTHILYFFPQVRRANFRLPELAWENNAEDFAAWAHARTGYPVVDAAMNQLAQTGWMHNRARMIVASFLTKDLLVNWRLGERFFMQHLLDGDPAQNNGGWQWTAGTGTDAAPYFRVFNPILQSKKYDPAGEYIRHWLPALAHTPDAYIHTPWEMPAEVQAQANCRIGSDYPQPLIDHGWARERALRVYGRA